MSVSVDAEDCLVLIESLQTLKQHISQATFWFKHVCERTKIFLPALKSFSSKHENEAELVSLKKTLKSLKNLLSDIQDFVSENNHDDNSFSISRKMVVNEEYRLNRAGTTFIFCDRIHEFQLKLLPAVDVSVEKTRAEDLEDFQLDMEAMVETMMEELSGYRMNPSELKRCLQAMKQDCSEGQTEISNKLSEVEAIVDANHDVSLMDLGGIEEVLYNSLYGFMALLKNKNTGKSIMIFLSR
jgi:hypothetical protein